MQYECANGHLRNEVDHDTHPDGSFAGRVCIECGQPASVCVE